MSDENIVILDVVTRLDIPAERVLNAALAEGIESVALVGYDKEGNEYFASSIASGAEVLWLFERAKKKLIDLVDELSGEVT